LVSKRHNDPAADFFYIRYMNCAANHWLTTIVTATMDIHPLILRHCFDATVANFRCRLDTF